MLHSYHFLNAHTTRSLVKVSIELVSLLTEVLHAKIKLLSYLSL